jgi:phospholipid/cholesterol/gamma-HCH transport system permease protein
MFREIGPLITGIIVIGRSGSALTASIGTMKVSEEIDALEVMGIDPVRHLVVPGFLAMTIMVPCLTFLAECMGLFGGWAVAYGSLHLDSFGFITRMITALTLRDVFSGLLKSVLFGALIGSIACFYGLRVEGGAAGVGRATTRSVVHSMTAILAADCVLTAIFYFL